MMGMPSRAALLGGAVLGTILAALGQRAYRAIPALPDRSADEPNLPVSVIVPARDEATNLARLLPSLRDQGAAEVIVVDDGSTDDTAAVAARHGARVVAAGPLPAGWTGKSRACAVGASAATSPWLAFIDADVRLRPNALRSLVVAAEEDSVDLASILPRQEAESFWEELLLPFAYRQYFAGVAIAPGTPLVNGQLVLARAESYARSGHAAPEVRGAIAEDLALAREARRRGARVRVWRGESVAAVRMYDGWPTLRAGFTKNAAAFLGASPRHGVATALATGLAAATLPFRWSVRTRGRFWKIVALALFAARLVDTARWNHFFLDQPPARAVAFALLEPLAAAGFGFIAVESLVRTYVLGDLTWKGRRYPGRAGRWS